MQDVHQQIFQDSPVAMAIEDGRQRFVEVNASFCDALRARADQLLEMDPARLIPMPPAKMAVRRARADDGESASATPPGRIQTLQRGDGTVGRFLVSRSTSAVPGGEPVTLWTLVELPETATLRSSGDGVVALNLAELLDSLPCAVLVLDADRKIVHANHRAERDLRLAAGRARPGTAVSDLGSAGWQRLDAELATIMRSPGTTQLTLELPMAGGDRHAMDVDVTVLTAVDGSTRLLLALRDASLLPPGWQRQLDEHRLRAQTETFNRASNGLVGLAALLQHNAPRHRPSERAMRNVASQLMALSSVYAWQARTPDRLPLASIVRSVVANQARAHALAIPLDRPTGRGPRTVPTQAILGEQDAIVVTFAMDELVAHAIAHRGAHGSVSARLLVQADAAVFEVRHDGRPRSGTNLDAIPSDTDGLGLLRTLLPAGATLRLAPDGDGVVASLDLRAPLLRFE